MDSGQDASNNSDALQQAILVAYLHVSSIVSPQLRDLVEGLPVCSGRSSGARRIRIGTQIRRTLCASNISIHLRAVTLDYPLRRNTLQLLKEHSQVLTSEHDRQMVRDAARASANIRSRAGLLVRLMHQHYRRRAAQEVYEIFSLHPQGNNTPSA